MPDKKNSIPLRHLPTFARRLIGVIGGLALAAMSTHVFADAALGTGVNYNNGTAVSAGQTGVPAVIDIENTSTPDTITVQLNTIQHLPSCGAYSVITCSSADPGVFVVNPLSGTGRTGTACAGVAFTFTSTGDGLGTYNVTWSGTITLAGPNGATNDLDKCLIDFTVDVVGAPDVDASGVTPGLQTRPSATTTGTGSNLTEAVGFGTTLVTVNKASPGISTSATAGPLPAGSQISDTATVTGGLNPTGTVTFNLYGPNDATCANAPVFTSANRPLSGGPPPTATSAAFTANVVGTYRWIATYNGDSNNNAVSGACNDANEASIIIQDTPSFSTTASATTVAGGSLTDTASLTNGTNPTGSITFTLYGPNDATCANTPAFTTSVTVSGNGNYVSSPAFTPTLVGTYRWIASYSGDTNNVAVSGACNDANESTLVNPDTPTLSTTASAGGAIGVSVTDTASLTNGTNPTGTITFSLYGPSATAVCDAGNLVFTSNAITVSGNGSYGPSTPSFTPTAVGTYRWIASYSGDANNNAVTGACGAANETVVITQATPGLVTVASAGGPIGTQLTDQATLSGGNNPTGTITFTLYGPNDATCANAPIYTSNAIAVSGNGSYNSSPAFTTTLAGTYRWRAVYSGDANNASVSHPCNSANESAVIDKSTPSIVTVASAGGVVGPTQISDTATVSGGTNPTGTVTFNLYGPNDASCSGSIIFTSTIALAAGSATSGNYTPTAPGVYRWVAIYNGDANNNSVTHPCNSTNESATITQATPTIVTVASATTVVGQNLSDTATVSGSAGTPTGTVTFNLYGPNDASCSGSIIYTNTVALSSGSANSGNFQATAPGVYRWVAIYNGNTNYASVTHPCNSANESTTVNQTTPTLVTVASAGGPVGTQVTDQATLSGAFNPTGSITFTLYGPNDATCANAPVYTSNAITVSGNGSYTSAPAFTTTQAGVFRWRAVYSGDANNASVSHPCNAANESVTIGQLTPTIVTTASAAGTVGTVQLSDTATVSGSGPTPTGNVTFNLYGPNDASCSGAVIYTNTVALAAGSANSGNFSPTAPGVYRWTASYAGDANYNAASHPCNSANESTTVNPATPSIITTASAGGVLGPTQISDTATVSGGFNPTGTVTFNLYGPNDASCSGSIIYTNTVALAAGSANSGNFTPTAAGVYRWTATYNGDANNNSVSHPCNSANESATITPANPTLVTQTAAAVNLGTAITDTATLSGGVNPTGTITFSLYGPNDAVCASVATFVSNPVPVNGNGAYVSTPSYTPLAEGTYRWIASYSGDANNNAVSGACNDAGESVVVTRRPPDHPVPTLSQWALLLLSLMLAGGAFVMRRRATRR